jgi:hypothetical protein
VEGENTVETSVQEGRNGGWLKVGNPGNNGGTGRPPNELRLAAREGFGKFIKKLNEMEDREMGVLEVARALDVCGKYGLGEAKVVVGEELVDAVAQAIAEEELPSEVKDRLIERIFARVAELG